MFSRRLVATAYTMCDIIAEQWRNGAQRKKIKLIVWRFQQKCLLLHLTWIGLFAINSKYLPKSLVVWNNMPIFVAQNPPRVENTEARPPLKRRAYSLKEHLIWRSKRLSYMWTDSISTTD